MGLRDRSVIWFIATLDKLGKNMIRKSVRVKTVSEKWRWPHHHPHLKKTKNHCIFWSLGFAFIMLLCSYYIIYYYIHIRSTSYVFYFYVPSQNAQQTVPSVFHEDQSYTTLTFNSVQLLLQTVGLQMWVIKFLSARGREGFQFETGRRV